MRLVLQEHLERCYFGVAHQSAGSSVVQRQSSVPKNQFFGSTVPPVLRECYFEIHWEDYSPGFRGQSDAG